MFWTSTDDAATEGRLAGGEHDHDHQKNQVAVAAEEGVLRIVVEMFLPTTEHMLLLSFMKQSACRSQHRPPIKRHQLWARVCRLGRSIDRSVGGWMDGWMDWQMDEGR